eukprot:2137860-Prymnesium_polylepis.2
MRGERGHIAPWSRRRQQVDSSLEGGRADTGYRRPARQSVERRRFDERVVRPREEQRHDVGALVVRVYGLGGRHRQQMVLDVCVVRTPAVPSQGVPAVVVLSEQRVAHEHVQDSPRDDPVAVVGEEVGVWAEPAVVLLSRVASVVRYKPDSPGTFGRVLRGLDHEDIAKILVDVHTL